MSDYTELDGSLQFAQACMQTAIEFIQAGDLSEAEESCIQASASIDDAIDALHGEGDD